MLSTKPHARTSKKCKDDWGGAVPADHLSPQTTAPPGPRPTEPSYSRTVHRQRGAQRSVKRLTRQEAEQEPVLGSAWSPRPNHLVHCLLPESRGGFLTALCVGPGAVCTSRALGIVVINAEGRLPAAPKHTDQTARSLVLNSRSVRELSTCPLTVTAAAQVGFRSPLHKFGHQSSEVKGFCLGSRVS